MVQAESDREGIFLVSCGEEFVSITVMSEETHPLKLKPRLPVAAADGAVEPPVASAPNALSPAGDPPRFRFKPKLASEPTGNPVASAPAAVAASPGVPTPPAAPMLDSAEAAPVIKLRPRVAQVAGPESPPPAAPELTADSEALRPPPPPTFPAGVGSAAVGDGEVPKFKLKPKSSEGSPLPPQLEPEAPALEIAASTPKSAPPFPVMAPPLGAGPRPPVPIHIRAPQIAVASDQAAAAEIVVTPPRRRKKVGLGALVGGLVLLGLAGGGAFLTFQHLSEEPPPPPKPRPKVVIKGSATATAEKTAGPTPSETLNALAAAPGKLIESAQEAVSDRRGNQQAGIDAIMDGRDPSGSPALGTPQSGDLVGRPGPALSSFFSSAAIAPGVSVTTEIQASKEASAAFRYIVTDAKVTGVYQGSPPRALINGRLIRVGQMLDEGLAISFEGIDAENRTLNFVDRSGARVSKRY